MALALVSSLIFQSVRSYGNVSKWNILANITFDHVEPFIWHANHLFICENKKGKEISFGEANRFHWQQHGRRDSWQVGIHQLYGQLLPPSRFPLTQARPTRFDQRNREFHAHQIDPVVARLFRKDGRRSGTVARSIRPRSQAVDQSVQRALVRPGANYQHLQLSSSLKADVSQSESCHRRIGTAKGAAAAASASAAIQPFERGDGDGDGDGVQRSPSSAFFIRQTSPSSTQFRIQGHPETRNLHSLSEQVISFDRCELNLLDTFLFRDE